MNSAPHNSLLHDLQNNEAILLMYLANELPAQDRAEVEHMLDRDEGLRLELSKLQQMYQGYHGAMRQVDSILPPMSALAAARAVGDVVRRRVGESVSVDDHDEQPRRRHWMIYPLATAAAVILIGVFVWWRYPTDDSGMSQSSVAENGAYSDGPGMNDGLGHEFDIDNADRPILRIFEPIRVFDAMPNGSMSNGSMSDGAMGGGPMGRGFSRVGDAQRQLAALRFLDDDALQ